MSVTLEMLPQFDRKRHGGLFDRGSADSWYSRPRNPHWYPEGSYVGGAVAVHTEEEIAEYNAGYDHNEQFGGKKSWD
jgi:hypothetical protein